MTSKNQVAISGQSAVKLATAIATLAIDTQKREDTARETVKTAQAAIEAAQKDMNAGKEAFFVAGTSLMDRVAKLLTGVPAISAAEYDDLLRPTIARKLAATHMDQQVVRNLLARWKRVVCAFTAGFKREDKEGFRPYSERAVAFLSTREGFNAKGAGRKKGQGAGKAKARKGADASADLSPMDHALALCGDNKGRAKALIVILKEHAEAFDTWAASVLG